MPGCLSSKKFVAARTNFDMPGADFASMSDEDIEKFTSAEGVNLTCNELLC